MKRTRQIWGIVRVLEAEILDSIENLIKEQSNGYLKVSDSNGNLVVNGQEVIQSVTIKDVESCGTEHLIAWYGMYGEDNYMRVTDCNVEMKLKILGACERAIE